MTSATPTSFIWYILAAIELTRTLSQSYVAPKSNVGSVTDKHDNVALCTNRQVGHHTSDTTEAGSSHGRPWLVSDSYILL